MEFSHELLQNLERKGKFVFNPEEYNKFIYMCDAFKRERYIDIVEGLNLELFDRCEDELVADAVTLNSNGYAVVIEFLGLTIWSEENDEREYDYETDTYEPLIPFLLKKIDEYIDTISKLKRE